MVKRTRPEPLFAAAVKLFADPPTWQDPTPFIQVA
jgi:hypothetical protein